LIFLLPLLFETTGLASVPFGVQLAINGPALADNLFVLYFVKLLACRWPIVIKYGSSMPFPLVRKTTSDISELSFPERVFIIRNGGLTCYKATV